MIIMICTLYSDDGMLQECGICTGQLMVLEVKKDSGTWPRGLYIQDSKLCACLYSMYMHIRTCTSIHKSRQPIHYLILCLSKYCSQWYIEPIHLRT